MSSIPPNPPLYFTVKQQQQQQQQVIHGNETVIGCLECDFSTTKVQEMSEHMYTTRHGLPQCPLCHTYVVPSMFYETLYVISRLYESQRTQQILQTQQQSALSPFNMVSEQHSHREFNYTLKAHVLEEFIQRGRFITSQHQQRQQQQQQQQQEQQIQIEKEQQEQRQREQERIRSEQQRNQQQNQQINWLNLPNAPQTPPYSSHVNILQNVLPLQSSELPQQHQQRQTQYTIVSTDSSPQYLPSIPPEQWRLANVGPTLTTVIPNSSTSTTMTNVNETSISRSSGSNLVSTVNVNYIPHNIPSASSASTSIAAPMASSSSFASAPVISTPIMNPNVPSSSPYFSRTVELQQQQQMQQQRQLSEKWFTPIKSTPNINTMAVSAPVMPFYSNTPNVSVQTPLTSFVSSKPISTAQSTSFAAMPGNVASPFHTRSAQQPPQPPPPTITTTITTHQHQHPHPHQVSTHVGGSAHVISDIATHRCMHCLLPKPSWTKMQAHLSSTFDTLPLCAVCGKELNCYNKYRPWKHEVDSYAEDLKPTVKPGLLSKPQYIYKVLQNNEVVEPHSIKPHYGFFGTYHARVEYKLETQRQSTLYHSNNKFTGLTAIQFRCVCGITFLNTVHLVNHLKRVHHVIGLPEQARCLTCHCIGTTEEIEVHMRGNIAHLAPSIATSTTTTTTTMTSSPNTNVNTPSINKVSFSTGLGATQGNLVAATAHPAQHTESSHTISSSTTGGFNSNTSTVPVHSAELHSASYKSSHEQQTLHESHTMSSYSANQASYNPALTQTSMQSYIVSSSNNPSGSRGENNNNSGNLINIHNVNLFNTNTLAHPSAYISSCIEDVNYDEGEMNLLSEETSNSTISDPFDSSMMSSSTPERSGPTRQLQLPHEGKERGTHTVTPINVSGEDMSRRHNQEPQTMFPSIQQFTTKPSASVPNSPTNPPSSSSASPTTATNKETKPTTTVFNKSHGRNLGRDRGGCPHEVDVPGFISAPFLHFTHFLPPMPLSHDDYNSNVKHQTSREPSMAFEPTPPLVQHDTQVKLSTLPNASVMLSALGRPIDHIPVYRVLYQCKECSALFSTWDKVTHHMECTLHGRAYCVKEHQFIPHQRVMAPRHPAPCTPMETRSFEEQESERNAIKEANKTRIGKDKLAFDSHSHRFDHWNVCGNVIGFPATPQSLEVLVDVAASDRFEELLDPTPEMTTCIEYNDVAPVFVYQCPGCKSESESTNSTQVHKESGVEQTQEHTRGSTESNTSSSDNSNSSSQNAHQVNITSHLTSTPPFTASNIIGNVEFSEGSDRSSQSTSTSSSGCREVFLYYGDFVEHILATQHGRKREVQVHNESTTCTAVEKETKDEHAHSTFAREGVSCKAEESNLQSQEMYSKKAQSTGQSQNLQGDRKANEQTGREGRENEKEAEEDEENKRWYMNEPFPMIAYRVMFSPSLLCQYYNFKKCEYCHRVFPANRLEMHKQLCIMYYASRDQINVSQSTSRPSFH